MQTTFTQSPQIGLPGQVSSGRHSDIATRFAEGECVNGLLAVAGASELKAKHPTAAPSAESIIGIVHLSSGREIAAYADGEQMGVVRKGPVWVPYEPDTVPAPDSQAYVRHTANGAGKNTLGMIRADADTGASVAHNIYIRKVDVSSGRCEVELN